MLASAATASALSAGADNAPFGASRSGCDESGLLGASGSGTALFICDAGLEAVVVNPPDVWLSNNAK